MGRKILLGAATGLLLLGAYLLAWPVPIDPVAWEAPVFNPAAWKPTDNLASAERVILPDGHGPEDIEVDAHGRIHAGLEDGRILRWEAVNREPTVLADTGGRPLGLHRDANGRLLVADARAGLLVIDRDGTIEVLATECEGRPLGFTNDLEVAADGSIWFSDASMRFHFPHWKHDILESRPHGRLCIWDPETREVRQALGGLHYANGVAIDPEQQFVLVNETARYRVQRLWIAGERQGEHEVMIDNLPGFPDGISSGTNGVFWIAIVSPRDKAVDTMAGSPWLRRVALRLPRFLQPAPQRTARVIGIDRNGKVIHDLFDAHGKQIRNISSVQEHAGHLYLGSLLDTAWARFPVP